MDIISLFIAATGAAGIALALPISSALLWSRTRLLRERLETLEQELYDLRREVRGREVRDVPDVPEVREVRAVRAVREVPEVQDVPEVRDVAEVPAPRARQPLAAVAHVAPATPEHADAPRALEHPDATESLESAIGSRWLLYVGIVAIVIGVGYFEKLAMDNGWITPAARVIQGALGGLALMGGGRLFVKRGYVGYGQILMGGGGAILYVSTYAAFNYYSLIAQPAAFALMVAITLLIAWLADRERSQALALFAVGGGFATPFMLPSYTDAQVALFTYDAILVAGTAFFAHRRDWPVLNLVSYGFTAMTVAAWAHRFYEPGKYLRTEFFLTLYAGLFLDILRQCRHKDSDAANVAAFLLASVPIVYYAASLAVLNTHDTALLVWLVALAVTGGVAASIAGPGPGLVGWLAVALPLVTWCSFPLAAQGMRQEGLVTLSAVYVIALLAQLEGTVFRDKPRDVAHWDITWLHLNPLGMYAGAYLLMSPMSLVNAGYVAAAFAAWHGLLAGAFWRRKPTMAIQFMAVGFTLTAIAIGLIFDGTAITNGWAVEGAVVIALGVRQRMDWLRIAGILLFAVAVAQTLLLLATPAPASHVVLLNPRAGCAALVVALCYLLAWLDWRDVDLEEREAGMGAALITAQVVSVALLTSEINAYWAMRDAYFERQLMFSVTWGLYATALVVIGLWRQYAPIRYVAIVLLAITIAKVFFVDLAELDRIYRVGSAMALGALLVLTSYLYTRARKGIDDQEGR